MGQYIQDGQRIIFETVIMIEKSSEEIILEKEDPDLDGLNYLAGKSVDFINKSAMKGTLIAHTDGDVPNLIINVPEQNEFNLGQLFYFEFACGISGYLLELIRLTSRVLKVIRAICLLYWVNRAMKRSVRSL